MAGAGVTQSVCLPLLSVYQLSTNGAIQVGAPSFCVGMCQESLPCPALLVVGAATPRDWRLLRWCGGFVASATLGRSVSQSLTFVLCSDICFIPQVSGCPLLAWGLSSLHVTDGTPP